MEHHSISYLIEEPFFFVYFDTGYVQVPQHQKGQYIWLSSTNWCSVNSTLINMFSKCAGKIGTNSSHTRCLFTEQVFNVQESTKGSPFYLLYGRDPCLPSECALTVPTTPDMIDLQDYRSKLTTFLSLMLGWQLKSTSVHKQKQQYDKNTKESPVKIRGRVMVHMPGTVKGKAWKLVRPFHEQYRVVSVTPTNAKVRLVDQPGADAIFVSLNRVRPCYPEIAVVSWSGNNKTRKKNRKQTNNFVSTDANPCKSGPVTRLMTRLAREQAQPAQTLEDKLSSQKDIWSQNFLYSALSKAMRTVSVWM